MNSKQSFFRSTLTLIFLAAFLGTPTCLAAIKPSINPQALAGWQQKVARIVWTAPSMNTYEINRLIGRIKPSQEELITNLAAVTSKHKDQPGLIARAKDFWHKGRQDAHVAKALQAFTEAQKAKAGSDQLKNYIETFADQFNQLDEENLIKLAKELNDFISTELKNLEKDPRRYKPTIKNGSDFLVVIRNLYEKKFKAQLDKLETKKHALKQQKSELSEKIETHDKQIEQLNTDIMPIQNQIHGKLDILLADWKAGIPSILIDIAIHPNPSERRYLPPTEEIYQIKWYEIEKNPKLTPLLQKLRELYNQKLIIEQNKKTLMHDLAQLNLEEEFERQELGEKHPAYAALLKLIEQWTQLDKRQQEIERERLLQSAKTEPPATTYGSTMTIPTSSEQQQQEEAPAPTTKSVKPIGESFFKGFTGTYKEEAPVATPAK